METRSISPMVFSPADRCRRKRISRLQFAAAMDNSHRADGDLLASVNTSALEYAAQGGGALYYFECGG
jgi:hypothetical protein